MIPPPEVKELTTNDYVTILAKHIWLIFAIFVFATGTVAFYDFSTPKKYEVKSTVIIEYDKPKIAGKVEDVYQGQAVIGREYYLTQLNILESRALAERVVKKLELDRDPEFINSPDSAGQLLSMIKVSQLKFSNIAVVSVRGTSPLKITAIANTWTREFIYQDIERRVGTAKYGVSFLESQLSDTLTKLNEAEKVLNNFLRSNKIVTVPDIESKTEALIENLKAQKVQVDTQIAEASKRYKSKHPKMLAFMSQAKSITEKLSEETNTRLALQEKMAEYGILKRKVETYKSLYDDFLKRAKELDVSKELTLSSMRVLDAAVEPKSPIRPRPFTDIPIAMMGSLLFGVFLSLFFERIDSSLKTSDDVEFYAKFAFLGYLPSAKREVREPKHRNLVAHIKPKSRIAEAVRNLKVSLIFSFPEDKPLRTMVITSSIPGEGKSLISCNLSIIFAQAKEPTILVDADMRKGNLHKTFDLKPKHGLSSILAGTASLDEAITPTFIPNLFLLSAGPYTPNPTELISSERLPNILRELEKKYRRVVIDSTPILNVAEALILGDKCDGVVFVIKAGSTSIKYILEAKKIIDTKVKIVGAILNNTEAAHDRYYYHHYYYSASRDKV